MLFADFKEWLGGQLMIVFFVVGFYVWLLRKFFACNPSVKDAAKKAVANKAISIMGRLFK